MPRRGPPRLVLVPTGPGQARTLRNDGIVEYRWASFMPDGKRILFLGAAAGHALCTYLTGLAGGAAVPVAPEGMICNNVSPDGRQLACNGTERGVLLLATGGGAPRLVPDTGAQDRPFAWSPDLRFLYVYQRGEVPARISRIELATGKRETWKQWTPADRAGVVSIIDPILAAGGSGYVFTYHRILSDLYLAAGLR